MAWQVLAVRYATLKSTRARQYMRWESYGEPDGPQNLAYFFWVLRDGARTVVVDTGFSPEAGRRRGRTMHAEPADGLGRIGIEAAQVQTLILTHLHYDHVGNVGLFSRARILAPGSELDFWSSPLAQRPQLRQHIELEEIEALLALERAGRVERFDVQATSALPVAGEPPAAAHDLELLPGVTAIALPGHSPGQHGLLIETDSRPVLLTSDAVHFYEELRRDRPFAIQTDLAQTYRSFDRIRELTTDLDAALVVGHDPLVAEQFHTRKSPDGSTITTIV